MDKSNVYIWPEWQESDISAEKWNTKVAFEDPDTHMYNHILGAQNITGWKRAHEFITDGSQPCVCNPGSSNAYLQRDNSSKAYLNIVKLLTLLAMQRRTSHIVSADIEKASLAFAISESVGPSTLQVNTGI
jgi:hypothetical protein